MQIITIYASLYGAFGISIEAHGLLITVYLRVRDADVPQ